MSEHAGQDGDSLPSQVTSSPALLPDTAQPDASTLPVLSEASSTNTLYSSPNRDNTTVFCSECSTSHELELLLKQPELQRCAGTPFAICLSNDTICKSYNQVPLTLVPQSNLGWLPAPPSWPKTIRDTFGSMFLPHLIVKPLVRATDGHYRNVKIDQLFSLCPVQEMPGSEARTIATVDYLVLNSHLIIRVQQVIFIPIPTLTGGRGHPRFVFCPHGEENTLTGSALYERSRCGTLARQEIRGGPGSSTVDGDGTYVAHIATKWMDVGVGEQEFDPLFQSKLTVVEDITSLRRGTYNVVNWHSSLAFRFEASCPVYYQDRTDASINRLKQFGNCAGDRTELHFCKIKP